MSFKLIDDSFGKKPVINSISVYNCKDFSNKISSITGITSKFLYIPKINELTGQVSNPSIKLYCTENCIDKCNYIK